MLECIMSYNQEESCKDRKGHWPLVRGSRQDWSLVKYWENELVWNLGIEIDYIEKWTVFHASIRDFEAEFVSKVS